MNKDQSAIIKVLGLRENTDQYYSQEDFLFEMFKKSRDNSWTPVDYVWLQNKSDEKYKKYQLTPFTEMNTVKISDPEDQFLLGIDGKLHTTVDVDGKDYVWDEVNEDIFNKIREEVIKNIS